MDAEVYPDRRVADYIRDHFIPVKIHIKEQPAVFERFRVQWTPTLALFEPESRHEITRFEGFLPPEDFLAQLELGLAKAAFEAKDFAEAENRFREIVDGLPTTTAAAEALYWAGVSRYKGTGDHLALKKTAAEFKNRYQDTDWAKKASVWAA